MINIAAPQPHPAPTPRQERSVQMAMSLAGALIHLVMPPEDALMILSQAKSFLTSHNTSASARTNVWTGMT